MVKWAVTFEEYWLSYSLFLFGGRAFSLTALVSFFIINIRREKLTGKKAYGKALGEALSVSSYSFNSQRRLRLPWAFGRRMRALGSCGDEVGDGQWELSPGSESKQLFKQEECERYCLFFFFFLSLLSFFCCANFIYFHLFLFFLFSFISSYSFSFLFSFVRFLLFYVVSFISSSFCVFFSVVRMIFIYFFFSV